jgi:molecular chaperone IbpA
LKIHKANLCWQTRPAWQGGTLFLFLLLLGGYVMNSIDWTPLYRNSIGFDRMASMLNSAMRAEPVNSTPAYNIEAMDEDHYAITLVAAGFEQSELDIEVNQRTLIIRGNHTEGDERKYLYQGIFNGSFERKFNLAEHVEVADAKLNNGLLTIHLKREVPESMKPKSIPIQSGDDIGYNKPEAIASEAA